MRIGLVVPGFSADYDDWGIPALRDLVTQLAPLHDVRILTLRYPFREARYPVFGADVIALGGGTGAKLRSAHLWQRTLRTLIAEHQRQPFDVLHGFWANETGAVTAIAGRLLHVPAVVTIAGGELVGLRDIAYGGQLAQTERIKVRLALTAASAVTAGSHSVLSLAAPWLRGRPASHALRLPFGVDTQLFAPGAPADNHPLRLLHVAGLNPVKDHATLFLAAAKVRQRGLSFVLDVVGNGRPDDALKTMANSVGVGDLVHFLGAVPHDQLPSSYRRADLFVLSSRHEAQGMVLLEAAACGLPIVATHVGVAPELAPHAAMTAPVGDADALAEAIAGLLSDPERRAAMGQAGRAYVVEQFALPECTRRFVRLYEELTGSAAGLAQTHLPDRE